MMWTEEERQLLAKLESGSLDGTVGEERIYGVHKRVCCGKYILNGRPVSYRQGETTRLFNGKETEVISGKCTEDYYETDAQKIEFLRRYGWLMRDSQARAYSAKYKPQARRSSIEPYTG